MFLRGLKKNSVENGVHAEDAGGASSSKQRQATQAEDPAPDMSIANRLLTTVLGLPEITTTKIMYAVLVLYLI